MSQGQKKVVNDNLLFMKSGTNLNPPENLLFTYFHLF